VDVVREAYGVHLWRDPFEREIFHFHGPISGNRSGVNSLEFPKYGTILSHVVS